MPPIISVVGKSESGKTTLIEKLIPELKNRGYRIGTIKHAHHNFDMDKEGKDSWRHKAAGSETVVIVSPGKISIVKDEDFEGLEHLEKATTGDKFKVDEYGYSYKQKQDLLVKGVEKPQIIRSTCKSKWGTKYEHVSYGKGKDILLKKGAIVTRSFGTITQDVSSGLKKKFITTKFEKLSLGGDVKSVTMRTDFGKVTLSSSEMVKFKHFIGSVTTGKGVKFSKGWTAC